MIFLSHNNKDKNIVEPIAIKLAEIYGQNNIFYDSWSIQPGDGIVDKMNAGLSEASLFFFFVSRNSLQSNMVKLEWQNALHKAMKNDCKFIPVKLDDCVMPAILLQNLYIDFYNYGFDTGLAQIIDVINGKNTFKGISDKFSNVIAKMIYVNEKEVIIELCATNFQEPISKYFVLYDNNQDDIDFSLLSDSIFTGDKSNDVVLNNGEKHNGYWFAVSRSTAPGFPVRVKIKTNKDTPINIKMVMKAKNETVFEAIPTIITNLK